MRALRLALAGALSATALTAATLASAANATTALKGCDAATYKNAGQLTVGTDNPVYEPWFSNNKPSNGRGYEAAFTYALASKLGFTKAKVKWITVPFDSSYAPGVKPFDFDINEISYTQERARTVAFSKSYYDVQQSVVVLKTSKYANVKTLSGLKDAKFGDQVGTTGMTYITKYLKPASAPRAYNTLDLAVAALQSKQIDAIVVDTPTGNYMVNYQITTKSGTPLAQQIGQFKSVGEYYGVTFQKSSTLVACVNSAIAALKADGTLQRLSSQYLSDYTSVPLLK
jgi:polar amino acid transport system substrate-binding protein